jgi:hypothetical protein
MKTQTFGVLNQEATWVLVFSYVPNEIVPHQIKKEVNFGCAKAMILTRVVD